MCFLHPFSSLSPKKGDCSEHVTILDNVIPLKIKIKTIRANRHTLMLRRLLCVGSQSRGVCPVLGLGGHILALLEMSSNVFPQYHAL